MVIIDEQKCDGCLACIIVCPVEALSWIDEKVVCDKEKCVECGSCVEACELEAIIL